MLRERVQGEWQGGVVPLPCPTLLKSADGRDMSSELSHTIHALGDVQNRNKPCRFTLRRGKFGIPECEFFCAAKDVRTAWRRNAFCSLPLQLWASRLTWGSLDGIRLDRPIANPYSPAASLP